MWNNKYPFVTGLGKKGLPNKAAWEDEGTDPWLHAQNKCVVTNVYAKVPCSVPESESATKEDRNAKVHEKNVKVR